MKKNLLLLLALGLVASLSMTGCSSDDDVVSTPDSNITDGNITDGNNTDGNNTDGNITDDNNTDDNITTSDMTAANILPF